MVIEPFHEVYDLFPGMGVSAPFVGVANHLDFLGPFPKVGRLLGIQAILEIAVSTAFPVEGGIEGIQGTVRVGGTKRQGRGGLKEIESKPGKGTVYRPEAGRHASPYLERRNRASIGAW